MSGHPLTFPALNKSSINVSFSYYSTDIYLLKKYACIYVYLYVRMCIQTCITHVIQMLSLERYRGVVGDEVIESLKQEAPENRTSMCLLTLYPYPTNSAWPQSAWKHCPNPLPDLFPPQCPSQCP